MNYTLGTFLVKMLQIIEDDIDFVYIDLVATIHIKSVKKILLNPYLPKIKVNGVIAVMIIANFSWTGVIDPVNDFIRKPDMVYTTVVDKNIYE